MARRVIREEGILCGGSSGASLFASIEAARDLKEDQNCVVILPDSIRNYMSKFMNDEWMKDHGFWSEDLETDVFWESCDM